jgi:DNA polymerase-3 subunit beta
MKSKTEFSIARGEMLGALLKVTGVVSSKSVILFEVKGGVLTVKGSNYETQIEASANLAGQSSDVAFCMDNSIVSMLKLLPEQPLAITVTEEREEKFTRINIVIVHASGKVELPALEASEYIEIRHEYGKTFSIPVKKLKRGFDKTRKFAGNDTLKPSLMSVYLDIMQDGITFVATDAFTLSRFKDRSLAGINARSTMIGITAANSIYSLLDGADSEEAVIGAGEKSVSVSLGNAVITSRAIEVRYPNYNAVIPGNNPVRFTVDSKCLSGAIRRLSLTADPSGNVIEMVSAGDEVLLSSCDMLSDRRAEEKIPAQCEGDIKIKTNISRMETAIDVIKGDAVLSFSDPFHPLLISPETDEEDTELIILLMPIA